MVDGARSEIDTSEPSLLKRCNRRVDHARKILDPIKLAHRSCDECCLNSRAQAFFIDRPAKTTCQPYSGLLKRHDLEAVATAPGGPKSAIPHRKSPVANQSRTMRNCHNYSFLLEWSRRQ